MQQTDLVLHTRERHDAGDVHHIVVNNPARLNTLDSNVMDALRGALEDAGSSDRARVVVLRGAGERAWIGGADINEMVNLDETTAVAFIRRLHGLCRSVRELPVPVIAAIRGYCLGAGLEVAACCDLRIGDEDSRYGMPEVRVGLPSVIEAAVLPRLIGIGRTRDLVMTARLIDSPEAYAWGLLDGLADATTFDDLVRTRVDEILSAAPGAMRTQKMLCRAWEEQPLGQAIETSIQAFGASFRSGEPREYLERFIQRKRTSS